MADWDMGYGGTQQVLKYYKKRKSFYCQIYCQIWIIELKKNP